MSQRSSRKRARDDDPKVRRNAKKRALATEKTNFPPDFWEGLDAVWLTPRSLRELNRINTENLRQTTPIEGAPVLVPRDVGRFARGGGPDLSEFLGVSARKEAEKKNKSQPPSQTESGQAQPEEEIVVEKRTNKQFSAYDKNLERHLLNNNIHPDFHSGQQEAENGKWPKNLRFICEQLEIENSPPTQQYLETYLEILRGDLEIGDETYIRETGICPILGYTEISEEEQLRQQLRQYLPFRNMDPLTSAAPLPPRPDYMEGAESVDFERSVLRDLSHLIVPSQDEDTDVLPNFFFDIKGERGGGEGAEKRQACYDGAYGARAMHALQNYGRQVVKYSGKAYTFSVAYRYHTANVQIFAHFILPPAEEGGLPEYRMSLLNAFNMAKDTEEFELAQRALKNTKALAERYRDKFIEAANRRAKRQQWREGGDSGSSGN